jgi:hypothetical protein
MDRTLDIMDEIDRLRQRLARMDEIQDQRARLWHEDDLEKALFKSQLEQLVAQTLTTAPPLELAPSLSPAIHIPLTAPPAPYQDEPKAMDMGVIQTAIPTDRRTSQEDLADRHASPFLDQGGKDNEEHDEEYEDEEEEEEELDYGDEDRSILFCVVNREGLVSCNMPNAVAYPQDPPRNRQEQEEDWTELLKMPRDLLKLRRAAVRKMRLLALRHGELEKDLGKGEEKEEEEEDQGFAVMSGASALPVALCARVDDEDCIDDVETGSLTSEEDEEEEEYDDDMEEEESNEPEIKRARVIKSKTTTAHEGDLSCMERTISALDVEMRASLRHIMGKEGEREKGGTDIDTLIQRFLSRGASSSSVSVSDEAALERQMQLASALSALQESIEAMAQKWEVKEKQKLMARASKHWKQIKANGECIGPPCYNPLCLI